MVDNLIVNKEQRIPDIGWFTGEPDPVSTSRDAAAARPGVPHELVGPPVACSGCAATCCCPTTRATPAPPRRAWSRRTPRSSTSRARRARSWATSIRSTTSPTRRARRPRAYPLPGFESGDPIGLPVDVALGKLDFYEVVGFSDHRATNAVWYRLLNCGFRHPGGRRHRRHDELRLAARPGGPEPGLREDGRAARLRPLPRRAQGRPQHGHERAARGARPAAARLERALERAGRRARASAPAATRSRRGSGCARSCRSTASRSSATARWWPRCRSRAIAPRPTRP